MLATDEHRVNHRNQPENKKGTITDAHKNISRLLHTTPQINHPASTPPFSFTGYLQSIVICRLLIKWKKFMELSDSFTL